MAPIRVLVVEDSRTIRARLREVLEGDPDLEIAGEAEDGKRAIELCLERRPDVVSLDMMLPVMTGVAATEYIMAYCPTPILIVSSSTNRGELFRTYDALAAGAVDVLEKPRGNEPEGEWERRYRSAIKRVSRIRVITHPRGRLGALGRVSITAPPPLPPPAAVSDGPPRLVALGASTGGPAALLDILRSIPRPLPVPTLLVLHIDEPFGVAFAGWLDAQTVHRVTYAREGQPVAAHAGRIVMAPPGRHLEVQGGHLHLTGAPERHSCRPSIDTLFESLAREYGRTTLACLLTGMGRDGAAGLLAVRRAGGITIAQDEATSVVYGMPREAVVLGAVRQVLPLHEIGPAIVQLIGAAEAEQR